MSNQKSYPGDMTDAQAELWLRLIRIFVDKRFSGKDFMRLVINTFGFILEAVLRSDKIDGFVVLPKRWIVE